MKEQRYKDPSLNRFVKTNMYYVNDPYILYQDPTYLGFKLFFSFDQPDSGLLSTIESHPNTAYSYLRRIGENQRAEYLKKFVEMLKSINSITPWFFQTIDGLGDAWKHGYNEDEFKAILPKDRKIKIGCLDESIDLRITALLDLYRKACFDWPNRREIVPQNLRFFKVGIYCYEARTINRTGSSIPMSKVQRAKNEQYPPQINKNQQSNTKKLLGEDPLSDEFSLDYKGDTINDNISRILFMFQYCEFLPDESGTFFDGMTNKEMKLSAQTITFSYRNVYEHNLFTVWSPNRKVTDLITLFVDSLALDNPQAIGDTAPNYEITSPNNPGFNVIRAIDSYLGVSRAVTNFQNLFSSPSTNFKIANAYGIETSQLPPIAQSALNEVQSTALGQLNNLLLGNVYGFGVGTIQSLGNANPSSLANQGINAIQGGDAISLAEGINSITRNVGFGESASITNKSESSGSSSQATGNPEASFSNSTKDTDNIGNVYQ
jgi:hypothetical protein